MNLVKLSAKMSWASKRPENLKRFAIQYASDTTPDIAAPDT
jgi:hypothetical protein